MDTTTNADTQSLGTSNFSTAVQQQLTKNGALQVRKIIWTGFLEWNGMDLGMPGETEAPCEALSTLVNNAPEVKGDTWPPKLNMLLVPVRVLGTLGGTYFLDVKKVIFKINSPDASMSLKRSVELGGVGYVRYKSDPTNPASMEAFILLFSNQHKAYVGLIPNDQVGFVAQSEIVLRRYLADLVTQWKNRLTASSTQASPGTTPTAIQQAINSTPSAQHGVMLPGGLSPPQTKPAVSIPVEGTSSASQQPPTKISNTQPHLQPVLIIQRLTRHQQNQQALVNLKCRIAKGLEKILHQQQMHNIQEATKSLPGTSKGLPNDPFVAEIKNWRDRLAEVESIRKRNSLDSTHVFASIHNFASREAPLPKFKISGSVPTPPNWENSLHTPHHALRSFLRIPVSPTSKEYSILAALVEPHLSISTIDRVINPRLWKKFVEQRTDLMSSKSDDVKLMKEFGLSDSDIKLREHINKYYVKDKPLTNYSDNVALLFHGTQADLDTILSQGLDERVGRGNVAFLGRGIYFADDPAKSAIYSRSSGILLMCVVYLGDCLNVDHLPKPEELVKEPNKIEAQKRNHTDLTFDSITDRPKDVNEYVIYNRSQCYPLYVFEYQRAEGPVNYNNLTHARAQLPPFAWRRKAADTLPAPPPQVTSWPFFAQTIFNQMEILKPEPVQTRKPEGKARENEKLANHLASLYEMGFLDEELNRAMLEKCKYSLENAIEQILITPPNQQVTHTSSSTQPQPSTSAASRGMADADSPSSSGYSCETERKRKASEPVAGSSSRLHCNGDANGEGEPMQTQTEEQEECPICRVEYAKDSTPSNLKIGPANELRSKMVKQDSTRSHWQMLTCHHKLCLSCYSKLETSRKTMSGQPHTFLKCPFCKVCSGVEIGLCSDGTMTVATAQNLVAAGYEEFGVLCVRYFVPSSPGLKRDAFFPNSPEGKKVVDLLRIAWDRRLCFTFGNSLTTGQQNVLVWNLPHKTALDGGPPRHGYPDPTYLQRVQDALAQFGIK